MTTHARLLMAAVFFCAAESAWALPPCISTAAAAMCDDAGVTDGYLGDSGINCSAKCGGTAKVGCATLPVEALLPLGALLLAGFARRQKKT